MGVFCLCFQAELLFYNSLCSRCRGVTPGLLLDRAKGHSEFIQVCMGCWSFRLRRHRQRAWMWSASFSYAPGNKRKKYCRSSIQSHLGVLYEKMLGVTNHKIDVTTTGFLGAMLSACLVLDASENADFQCRLLILQGSVSHCPSSWALKARKPPKYTKTLLVETLILCLSSHLLLHILVVLLIYKARKKVWFALRFQDSRIGLCGHNGEVWGHHRGFHLFGFKTCSPSLLMGHVVESS